MSLDFVELYGLSFLILYIALAGVYGLSRFRIARIRAEQVLLDDVESGQNNGVTFPDSLLARIPTRNDIAVRLLRERIRSRQLVNVLQVFAGVLALFAGGMVFAYLFFYVDRSSMESLRSEASREVPIIGLP